MLNKIIIMGRLGKAPEVRRTQSGTAVASFSLAVDRDIADKKTGKRETDWIDVVAWSGRAEFAEKYLDKGRMVVVEGRLQVRGWTDRDGNKRRNAEVIADNIWFADSKRDGGGDTSNTIREDEIPEQRQEFTEEDDDASLPF